MVGLCHDDVIHNIPIKIGTDVDRRSHAFNASGRGPHPIVIQPTAPPASDGSVNQPLLMKNAHTTSKPMEYVYSTNRIFSSTCRSDQPFTLVHMTLLILSEPIYIYRLQDIANVQTS